MQEYNYTTYLKQNVHTLEMLFGVFHFTYWLAHLIQNLRFLFVFSKISIHFGGGYLENVIKYPLCRRGTCERLCIFLN